MEWTDRGIVLGGRKHGEAAVILDVLTPDRGRCKGLVRGGAGKRLSGALQPGNELLLTWRARLHEHLGAFQAELKTARAAYLIEHPGKLAVATASCALVQLSCPEHEPHRALFDGLSALLDSLRDNGAHEDAMAAAYIAWEAALLTELGFGLDLTQCALSGARDGLAFVSPRTGRAVTAEAAGHYREHLLPLPAFLAPRKRSDAAPPDLLAGFALTGHFLERHVLAPHGQSLPPARDRLVERFRR